MKAADLLSLGELRRQLAASEQRVAEVEALLEESKKKDGLLGLVQKAHQTIRKDMGDADRAMNEMRTRWGIAFVSLLAMLLTLYRVSNVWSRVIESLESSHVEADVERAFVMGRGMRSST